MTPPPSKEEEEGAISDEEDEEEEEEEDEGGDMGMEGGGGGGGERHPLSRKTSAAKNSEVKKEEESRQKRSTSSFSSSYPSSSVSCRRSLAACMIPVLEIVSSFFFLPFCLEATEGQTWKGEKDGDEELFTRNTLLNAHCTHTRHMMRLPPVYILLQRQFPYCSFLSGENGRSTICLQATTLQQSRKTYIFAFPRPFISLPSMAAELAPPKNCRMRHSMRRPIRKWPRNTHTFPNLCQTIQGELSDFSRLFMEMERNDFYSSFIHPSVFLILRDVADQNASDSKNG